MQLITQWHLQGELERNHVTLFAGRVSADEVERALDSSVLVKLTIVRLAADDRSFVRRLFNEQWVLPREARRRGIDVLFCPGNVIPYATGIPTVATLQNAAPFSDTITPRSVGFRKWVRFAVLGLMIRATLWRATRLVFLSSDFRDMVAARFGDHSGHSAIIPRACAADGIVADAALERRLGIRRPYLLYVSHLYPYKNVVEVVEGFLAASERIGGRQLVLVGMPQFPDYLDRIEESIYRHRAEKHVLITGDVPHREALSLMAGCESFVFASSCESCPTALIEAMHLGAPIAASNLGAMKEIAGEATLLFDPFDPDAIGSALLRLMESDSLRRELRAKALARARELPDASAVASSTLRLLHEAAAIRVRPDPILQDCEVGHNS